MILRGFKYYTCIYFIEWILQLSVEQNPVILNTNSGANVMLYIIWVHKLYLLYYILYTYLKNMSKCNVYYWPDMGWEPVWHGLWINKAEFKENLPKHFKLKGAILKWLWLFLTTRQKWDRTRLALPHFCHFSGPPM